jgi:hypothetical protein
MPLITQAAAGGQALMLSDPKKYPNLGSAITAFAQQQIDAAEQGEASPKKAPVPTPTPVRKGILGDGSLVNQIPQR